MIESEVLVIGGGIAGASTAFYLAQHGLRVTLLESGEIASEASGVNAGGLGGLGWGNYPDLHSYLTMGSLELFKSIHLDLGYDVEFRRSGGLQAIHTEEQYEYSRDKVLGLRSQGYSLELLTAREARSIEPEANPELLGFVYSPGRGQADPVKTTKAFASAAQNEGARVLDGHEVTALARLANGDWQVGTRRGEFRAGTLVLAAGAWCRTLGAMLGLDIPILPVRGQMWATGSLPPALFHLISSAESEPRLAPEARQRCRYSSRVDPPFRRTAHQTLVRTTDQRWRDNLRRRPGVGRLRQDPGCCWHRGQQRASSRGHSAS